MPDVTAVGYHVTTRLLDKEEVLDILTVASCGIVSYHSSLLTCATHNIRLGTVQSILDSQACFKARNRRGDSWYGADSGWATKS